MTNPESMEGMEEPDAVGVAVAKRRVGRASFYTAPTITVLIVLALWQLVTSAFHVSEVILPSPVAVIQNLAHNWGTLLANTAPTAEETVLGFLFSMVVGIPLGVLLANSKLFSAAVYPLVVGAQTIPKVAIAPLFVIWMGFGVLPKILITFLVAFFPIVVDTTAGLQSVPKDMRDLARILRLSPMGAFRRIQFPYALPQIFAGLKVGMTLAVIGAIVGEFVGANQGLGYLLMAANGNFNTPLMFADLVLLTALGVLLFMMVQFVEGLMIPWHVSKRVQE